MVRGITRLQLYVAALALILIAAFACSSDPPTSTPTSAPTAMPATAAPTAMPGSTAMPATAMPATAMPTAMPGEMPKSGGILRLAHREDPVLEWDPSRTRSISLFQVASSVFGGGNLVRPCRENSFEVCPYAAESWESNGDNTVWTFTVRDDILWHDGEPFTLDDVEFWLELSVFGLKEGDNERLPNRFLSADLSGLETIEKLDGNRIRLNFSEEKPHLVAQLARPHFAIAYPKHLMQPEIDNGNITVSPLDVGVVGIGPFMLDNVQKGSVVQVRRFDSYFETDDHGQRLPYLDGIDFFITMNPDAMDAAFLSGRVDGGARGPGFNLSKERAEVYEGDLGDDVQFVRVGFYGWGFDFNTVHESPVQDVRVRRAMALWINKQDAIDAVLGGFGEKFTLLDSGNPYTNPDFETWLIYDDSRREEARAEAKRLLAEAGYADGLTLKENCWTVAQQSCEYIQAQLAELGITMDFKIVDTPGYSATSVTLDNDTNSASGWPSGNAIPEMIRQDLAPYSTNPGASFQHEDPRIEEYFGQLEAAGTLDERIRIFREMEEYIIREQVYRVSLYGETAVTPYRSYVKGYQPPAGNVNVNYDHATTWLDK